MNIFKVRKFIFTNLFLFNLVNFSYPVYSIDFLKKSFEIDNFNKSHFSEFSALRNFSDYTKLKDYLEFKKKLALEGNIKKEFQLDIQSDKQYQQDSVLYAEGNVLAS